MSPNFFNTRIADGFGAVIIALVSLLLILLCARFFYKRGIFDLACDRLLHSPSEVRGRKPSPDAWHEDKKVQVGKEKSEWSRITKRF